MSIKNFYDDTNSQMRLVINEIYTSDKVGSEIHLGVLAQDGLTDDDEADKFGAGLFIFNVETLQEFTNYVASQGGETGLLERKKYIKTYEQMNAGEEVKFQVDSVHTMQVSNRGGYMGVDAYLYEEFETGDYDETDVWDMMFFFSPRVLKILMDFMK